MQPPKKSRLGFGRYGAFPARSYKSGIKKLKAGFVFKVLELLGIKTFYTRYMSVDYWRLKDLKEVIDPKKKALLVKLYYKDIQGRDERGNLITLLLILVRRQEIHNEEIPSRFLPKIQG